MKRFTIHLLLLLIAGNAIGQAGTTETEYNYIKNRVHEIESKGDDVKRGYFLEDIIDNMGFGNGYVSVKQLRRESDSTVAGTWVKIYVSGTWSGNGTFYFCIPSTDMMGEGEAYGWTQFYTDLNNAGNTCKDAFLRWMAIYYSAQNGMIYPAKKVKKKSQ